MAPKRNRAVIVALLLTVLFAAPSLAQLPSLPKIQQFGIDGFRLMLQQQGLSATQTEIGSVLDTPNETVVVVLGDLKTVIQIRQQLTNFVRDGGAMLIAADQLGKRTQPSYICGAWIKPASLPSRKEREKHAFRDFVDCPVVTELERSGTSMLFEDVNRIVTNRPAGVRTTRAVRPIAWLPPKRQQPLMVTYERDKGRMLMVSDHSIFINEMLVHGDNAKFASNVTRWLCENGKRSNLVLIHNGNVLGDWGLDALPPEIPLETLLKAVQSGALSSLPVGDTLLPIVNDAVAQAQERNIFNEFVRQAAGWLFGNRPNRWLVFVTTLLAVAAFGWFTRARWRPRKWLSFQNWQGGIEPRLVGAVREQQFAPYLRTLVREFFVEGGATHFAADEPAPVIESGRVPRKKIDSFWKLATEQQSPKITRKQFSQQLTQLRELRQLQLAGELRLQWPHATSMKD